MNKKYFLNDGKKQIGPLSFDEIAKTPLKGNEKVWTDNFDNWKDVSTVEEFSPFIIRIPPPLYQQNNRSKKIAKEIKINFKLIIISLIICLCAYIVSAYINGGFKSLYYRSTYAEITNPYYGINASDNLTSEQIASKKEEIENEVRDYLPSKDIVVFSVASIAHIYWIGSLNNNIQSSFGENAIVLFVIIFLLLSIILILGRYLLNFMKKGLSWVNLNSKD